MSSAKSRSLTLTAECLVPLRLHIVKIRCVLVQRFYCLNYFVRKAICLKYREHFILMYIIKCFTKIKEEKNCWQVV